jgi:hypothetical protein
VTIISMTTSGALPISRGIVYVAFGERSARAVSNSYHSILKYCNLPALVVGDYHVPGIPHCYWNGMSPWAMHEPLGQRFYAGRVKPFLYDYSPFDRTLYLDADTEAYDSVTQGFEYLDNYDICIADDPRTLESTFRHSKPGPKWDWIREQRDFTHNYLRRESNPQINTGVIFFAKSDLTKLFFENWYEEWQRFPRWDEQMAFMRAEHNLSGSVAVCHLDTKWNTNNSELPDKIIHHMWGQQKARDLYAD